MMAWLCTRQRRRHSVLRPCPAAAVLLLKGLHRLLMLHHSRAAGRRQLCRCLTGQLAALPRTLLRAQAAHSAPGQAAPHRPKSVALCCLLLGLL